MAEGIETSIGTSITPGSKTGSIGGSLQTPIMHEGFQRETFPPTYDELKNDSFTTVPSSGPEAGEIVLDSITDDKVGIDGTYERLAAGNLSQKDHSDSSHTPPASAKGSEEEEPQKPKEVEPEEKPEVKEDDFVAQLLERLKRLEEENKRLEEEMDRLKGVIADQKVVDNDTRQVIFELRKHQQLKAVGL